jgi:hypothetical protein
VLLFAPFNRYYNDPYFYCTVWSISKLQAHTTCHILQFGSALLLNRFLVLMGSGACTFARHKWSKQSDSSFSSISVHCMIYSMNTITTASVLNFNPASLLQCSEAVTLALWLSVLSSVWVALQTFEVFEHLCHLTSLDPHWIAGGAGFSRFTDNPISTFISPGGRVFQHFGAMLLAPVSLFNIFRPTYHVCLADIYPPTDMLPTGYRVRYGACLWKLTGIQTTSTSTVDCYIKWV